MKQSRRASWIESFANIAIGCGVALLSQLIIFPLVGIFVDMQTNLIIVFIFTTISIVRSFIVRRFFEHLRVKGILP